MRRPASLLRGCESSDTGGRCPGTHVREEVEPWQVCEDAQHLHRTAHPHTRIDQLGFWARVGFPRPLNTLRRSTAAGYATPAHRTRTHEHSGACGCRTWGSQVSPLGRTLRRQKPCTRLPSARVNANVYLCPPPPPPMRLSLSSVHRQQRETLHPPTPKALDARPSGRRAIGARGGFEPV